MTASAPAARTGKACRSASASRRCAWTASPSAARPEVLDTPTRVEAHKMSSTTQRPARKSSLLRSNVEPFYVPSGSMEPTLLIGDELLATKYPYGYGTASLPAFLVLPDTGHVFAALPKRGDVVVFR